MRRELLGYRHAAPTTQQCTLNGTAALSARLMSRTSISPVDLPTLGGSLGIDPSFGPHCSMALIGWFCRRPFAFTNLFHAGDAYSLFNNNPTAKRAQSPTPRTITQTNADQRHGRRRRSRPGRRRFLSRVTWWQARVESEAGVRPRGFAFRMASSRTLPTDDVGSRFGKSRDSARRCEQRQGQRLRAC
jgi:hypothetical protein